MRVVVPRRVRGETPNSVPRDGQNDAVCGRSTNRIRLPYRRDNRWPSWVLPLSQRPNPKGSSLEGRPVGGVSNRSRWEPW